MSDDKSPRKCIKDSTQQPCKIINQPSYLTYIIPGKSCLKTLIDVMKSHGNLIQSPFYRLFFLVKSHVTIFPPQRDRPLRSSPHLGSWDIGDGDLKGEDLWENDRISMGIHRRYDKYERYSHRDLYTYHTYQTYHT